MERKKRLVPVPLTFDEDWTLKWGLVICYVFAREKLEARLEREREREISETKHLERAVGRRNRKKKEEKKMFVLNP